RPSADGGASRRERNAATGRTDRAFRLGAPVLVNARSAWNVSLVIRPRQTISHSADTVSAGYPPPAASCTGAKNEAPWVLRKSRIEVSRDDASCGFNWIWGGSNRAT